MVLFPTLSIRKRVKVGAELNAPYSNAYHHPPSQSVHPYAFCGAQEYRSGGQQIGGRSRRCRTESRNLKSSYRWLSIVLII